MFFVKLGKFAAWAILVVGILKFATGFIIATISDTPETRIAISKRYLGSQTTGEAIDQGLMIILIAIVLGLLVKIAQK
ncbi:MAG: hypothetical protein ABJM86_01415 [Hyphomicrobiales bacterium]